MYEHTCVHAYIHTAYRSPEIIRHKKYFVILLIEQNYFTENLYKLLLIVYEFFRFHVAMVTLDQYFKRKDSLPNPNGDRSLNITPGLSHECVVEASTLRWDPY